METEDNKLFILKQEQLQKMGKLYTIMQNAGLTDDDMDMHTIKGWIQSLSLDYTTDTMKENHMIWANNLYKKYVRNSKR